MDHFSPELEARHLTWIYCAAILRVLGQLLPLVDSSLVRLGIPSILC
jgi:hypothetical protein